MQDIGLMHAVQIYCGQIVPCGSMLLPHSPVPQKDAGTLCIFPSTRYIELDSDFHWDITLFFDLLAQFNGVFITNNALAAKHHIYCDSCLTCRWAIYQSNCYRVIYPPCILQHMSIMCHIEALNCMASLEVWAHLIARTTTCYAVTPPSLSVHSPVLAVGTHSSTHLLWLHVSALCLDLYIIPQLKPEMGVRADDLSTGTICMYSIYMSHEFTSLHSIVTYIFWCVQIAHVRQTAGPSPIVYWPCTNTVSY